MDVVCGFFEVLQVVKAQSQFDASLHASYLPVRRTRSFQFPPPTPPSYNPHKKMKLFSIASTVLALLAIQICHANPLSFVGTPHHRSQALPAPPSLTKQLLRFVAELRQSLNPRSPILSTRIAESLVNGSTPFNSSTPTSPSNETAQVRDYIVEAGDTFDSIAAKLGTTATALEIANPGLDPLDLGIGDVVIIPQGFVGSGNGTTVGNGTTLSAEDSTALPPSSTALPPSSSASDGAFNGWDTWIDVD